MIRLFLVLVVMMTSVRSYSQSWKVYPYKPGGSLISIPADEGHHTSEPIEWWYTAGHLTGSQSGKTYTYMLTYFYYPASSYGGFRILNITDEATGVFYQDAKFVRYTTLSTSRLDIHASVTGGGNEFWTTKIDSQNKLVPFEYTIKASSATTGLDLNCISLKRPLILGDDGYLEQGISNYTYYYSQTSNAIAGKLTLDGITQDVTGISWIDRQYGNFNPLTGEKYEWFHLQLSNGMDVNLWEDSPSAWGPLYGFGKLPFGNPSLSFATQAPFHMGYYHESPLIYAAAFEEGGVTWANQPSFEASVLASAAGGPGEQIFDLTSQVAAWVATRRC